VCTHIVAPPYTTSSGDKMISEWLWKPQSGEHRCGAAASVHIDQGESSITTTVDVLDYVRSEVKVLTKIVAADNGMSRKLVMWSRSPARRFEVAGWGRHDKRAKSFKQLAVEQNPQLDDGRSGASWGVMLMGEGERPQPTLDLVRTCAKIQASAESHSASEVEEDPESPLAERFEVMIGTFLWTTLHTQTLCSPAAKCVVWTVMLIAARFVHADSAERILACARSDDRRWIECENEAETATAPSRIVPPASLWINALEFLRVWELGPPESVSILLRASANNG
jgi:hypothetical protein